jgi:hypothetical protein
MCIGEFTGGRIWRNSVSLIVIVLFLAVAQEDPVEGWAVLMETNDFPEGLVDLPVDFVDVKRMQDMLLYHGWQKSHIMVKKDGITQETIKEGIEHLKNADKNDIALFYIASHGGYLRYGLRWNEAFPVLWDEIKTDKRVLIIDSCYSGSFLPESDRSHIAISSVSAQELGWVGVPKEGLSVIGFVFTYYFCESMKSDVSVEEGFEKTVPLVREYMKEIVYPEFKDVYSPKYYFIYNPHPVIDDQYPGYLYLEVEHTASFSVLLVLMGILLVIKNKYDQMVDDRKGIEKDNKQLCK